MARGCTVLATTTSASGAPCIGLHARGPPPAQVVVVGGGAGGLVTAGRLAKAGCEVTLVEKNAEVGGRLQSVCIDGWRFDTGPSLLLFPDKYAEAFASLGARLEESLQLRRVGPAAYRVHFAGGGPPSSLDLLYDVDAMAAQLEGVEAGAGDAYRSFLAMARRHLDLGVPHFIDRDFTELKDAWGLRSLLPSLASVNPWQLLGPHDLVLRGFFGDARLRAALSFQDLYVGLRPSTAPAVFSLLAGTELTDGVFYPVGGFGAVRDALRAAAESCGVVIRTGANVAAIEVGPGRSVAGVRLAGGEAIAADVVVCNRDLPAAYDLLRSWQPENSPGDGADGCENGGPAAADGDIEVYAARRSEQLGALQYSAGVIAYNWCVDGRLDALLHHNTFLSDELDGAWRLAATPGELVQRPNFYVHCPTRTDPTAAPEGCDSVMVLLPVATTQPVGRNAGGGPPAGDYATLVDAGRQRILQTFVDAGVGDIAGRIRHELVIAPPEWERRYGLRYGAAFGLSHGLDQLSLFRPANKDAEVQGLYFVGASTRPGNGVPLCFISAKLTAERVLKDLTLTAASSARS